LPFTTIISSGMLWSPEGAINRVYKMCMKMSLFLPCVPLTQSNSQTIPTLKAHFNSITYGEYSGYWNLKILHAILFLDTQPLQVLQQDPNGRVPSLFLVN